MPTTRSQPAPNLVSLRPRYLTRTVPASLRNDQDPPSIALRSRVSGDEMRMGLFLMFRRHSLTIGIALSVIIMARAETEAAGCIKFGYCAARSEKQLGQGPQLSSLSFSFSSLPFSPHGDTHFSRDTPTHKARLAPSHHHLIFTGSEPPRRGPSPPLEK